MGKGVLLKIYSERDDFLSEVLAGKIVSGDGKTSHESVRSFFSGNTSEKVMIICLCKARFEKFRKHHVRKSEIIGESLGGTLWTFVTSMSD